MKKLIKDFLAWFATLTPRRKVIWVIVVLILIQGFYITGRRYLLGLGSVTNLSDHFPWGFWIGFDVMGGVALAAGGFTLCCLVYVFGYHRYHSIVRPTVLTAFLGYLLVAVGLLYDLGKYFNIWHAIVFWNEHSVMFEVAWCVMLYLAVLFLEFLPVVFEKFKWGKALQVMQKLTIPLILTGVILSTLHQSSLGSLFLIAPEKLHPFWYSSILPLHFFLSAVAVGPAMVIVESNFSSRLFRRGLELPILADLARFLQVALILYIGVRFQDVFARGLVSQVFSLQFETLHFWLENLLFIVPFIILAIPGKRFSPNWLLTAASMVVGGVVYNRLNVSWIGMLRASGTQYSPRITEILISLFLVTLGAIAFYFIAKYFPVFPKEGSEEHVPDAHGADMMASPAKPEIV
ncbi:MAG: Ni/Fe-hydrogenase cytochrome b subunit [bacterium]